MRQLLPTVENEVDPTALIAGEARVAPEGRPWVLLNMIASVDGATAVEGRSGALGGLGDKAVFAAVRAVADVILVGAGTVRAEGYGPPVSGRLAVVSGRLDLDPAAALFAGHRPIVITSESSDADRRAALAAVADVVVAGRERVDLALALASLRADVVVCEGGPRLNAQLFADGLVDEIRVTVSPTVAGGTSPRVTNGPALDNLCGLDLGGVLEDDGFLFLRYLRRSV